MRIEKMGISIQLKKGTQDTEFKNPKKYEYMPNILNLYDPFAQKRLQLYFLRNKIKT